MAEDKIQDFVRQLETLANSSDHKLAHIEADAILEEVLEELGLYEIVEAYNEVGKWYANKPYCIVLDSQEK